MNDRAMFTRSNSDTGLSTDTGNGVLEALVAVMARLRDPDGGCPWDLAQDFASIAPYTIEEAYEVADACARDDMAALKDELGDLLLQVVFHSQMAREAGHFTISDVVSAIVDKMLRRHPHVFGDIATDDPESVKANWESIKAEERSAAGHESALDGVALALPALMRAEKLQKRAARTGFDWPDAAGARAKLIEEIDEVDAAGSPEAMTEEFGDLLFAAVNWARHLGIDSEAALRAGNAKFESRFKVMETIAGSDFKTLPLDAKEALWQRVKRAG